MTTQAIVGSDYLDVPGNNERWFPWHLALLVLAVATLAGGWSRAGAPPAPARWTAAALFALAGFVALAQWLPALADMMHDSPTKADYLESPTMTWLIALLDLGFAVPAAMAAGVGLLRGARWGGKAVYAVAGFFALVGPAVAAMAITMRVNDDPNAASANIAVMVSAGLALALLGISVYRPLLRARRPATGRRSEPGGTFVPIGRDRRL